MEATANPHLEQQVLQIQNIVTDLQGVLSETREELSNEIRKVLGKTREELNIVEEKCETLLDGGINQSKSIVLIKGQLELSEATLSARISELEELIVKSKAEFNSTCSRLDDSLKERQIILGNWTLIAIAAFIIFWFFFGMISSAIVLVQLRIFKPCRP